MSSSFISRKLNLSEYQVNRTLELLAQDCTVPFIARYRKELTGNLDELTIFEIQKQKKFLDELEKRKQYILNTLEEQAVLSDELKDKIINTYDVQILEDIYLPYKKTRKTKADKARKAGLEPLAKIIMAQNHTSIEYIAKKYICEQYSTVEKVLEGATHIIAEWINENLWIRNYLRKIYLKTAVLHSKVISTKKDQEKARTYSDYFDWNESLKYCPSHRLLAMLRGEREGFLRLKLQVDREELLSVIYKKFIKNFSTTSEWIEKSIDDAYKRLLEPSVATETINYYKEKAEKEAIKVFAQNLRQLLLASPLGQKRVLAIDPGFRTGCKIAILNETGDFLFHDTIFPHPPKNKKDEAASKLLNLIDKYKIEAIGIGNGTAARETEFFVKNINLNKQVQVFSVNEAGASIYSASEVAREEFPDLDLTVRGAISIGRRLQDPLAELVKIEPKSIGVGQYQHDVNQTLLKEELEHVVESVVNSVGVNLNTAGKYLLKNVSGIGEKLAERIVEYRKMNGAFTNRNQLLKVKGLGKKAFEQSAGFLRIKNGNNPLDATGIHPEAYVLVEKMATHLGVSVNDFIGNENVLQSINPNDFVTEKFGLPSLQDIIKELKKPGMDIRKPLENFSFDPSLQTIDDLVIGKTYPAIVNNITNFGCFVDLGIKENGLIHISNLSDNFVKDPNDIVKLNQQIVVKVLSIDKERKRIGLALV